MDHGQLKYKMENNMCNKVKSTGSYGSLEKDDSLLEKKKNALRSVLGTRF